MQIPTCVGVSCADAALALKIIGRRESKTGGNTHYKLSNKKIVNRSDAVKMVKAGKLPGYHTVTVNKKKYLRDNPDKRKKDNIDSQPLI